VLLAVAAVRVQGLLAMDLLALAVEAEVPVSQSSEKNSRSLPE